EVHPSLWFSSGEIAIVKARKDAGGYAVQVWNYVTNAINTNKNRSVSSTSPSTRPILAKTLAFAWVMNRDSLARQKAIEALLIAYDNVPRAATSANFGDDYDEIYRATWLQNYCAAYDWMAGEMTPQQDSTVRTKLIQEMLLLKENMVSGVRYAPRPHNHRSKPAWAIGTAALTFASDPRASDWLRFALEQQNSVTKYQFSADGVYREGPHYFMYNNVNCIPFLWQYKNVSSVDLFPFYRAAFEWPIRIRTSRGWMPNIEDSYIKLAPTHMVAKAYVSTASDLNTSEPLARVLQWNWFNSDVFTRNYTGASNDVTWDIDEYLTYDQSIGQSAPSIPPTLRLSSGQVVFRNNWRFKDISTRYLLFHGVAEADNHQHPDLLSYFMDSHSAILAVDAGYGKNGFDDAKRAWYTSPEAHNIVMTNGSGPLDLAVNIPPAELHFLNTPFYDFAEKEARTSAPGGKLRRGIAFPHEDYWVVYDLARGTERASYKLNIHSRGSFSRTANRATWTTAGDTFGYGARLSTYILASDSSTMIDKTGWTSLVNNSEEPQQFVEISQSGDSVMFLHLLFPAGSSAVNPIVHDKSTSTVLAFEVAHDGDSDLFLVQQRRFLSTAGETSTDALFAWANSRLDKLLRFAVNEGKTFRWRGDEYFQSEFPLTVAAEIVGTTGRRYHIESVSQPTSLIVRLASPNDTVLTAKLNGAPVPFSMLSDGRISLVVTVAGVLEIAVGPITSTSGGFHEIPRVLRLETVYPNPFNPCTRLRYEIPTKSQVAVRVFNVRGQLVRALVSEELPAGVFEKTWDGSDEAGRHVSTGVYIFELTDGARIVRAKGILLR
ncbi:MAG TPA: hypothetical protein DCP63_06120, partial [Bacteroidetes bacterium]|nr:hypothetical protein [Bacteroidota bacterium]